MRRVGLLIVLLGTVVSAACSDGTGPAPTGDWALLTTGASHTCGVTTGGTAYCWGSNATGELGATATMGECGLSDPAPWPCSSVPVAVAGGLTFTQLTAGVLHTCGVTRAGVAYCWGYNKYGTLGVGGEATRSTPEVVAGGLAFASLTAGTEHTCGLTSVGTAYCWGIALRLGTTAANEQCDRSFWGAAGCSTVPIPVDGGLTFASLTASESHTCGVTSGGAAYCWGYNAFGKLGDSSATTSQTPVAVAGGLTFASLTAGQWHTCGLTGGGVAYCWGHGEYGELGNGLMFNSLAPAAVAGGLRFVSLQAGFGSTCGLTNSSAAYCWGANGAGQLGDGSTTNRSSPVAVAGGLTFTSLTPPNGHTCGVTSGGAAYCWGFNLDGQLGDGSKTTRLSPVAVVNP